MRKRILSLAIVALVVVLLLPSPAFAMGNYVASKNSDVYHDPDCSYVGRIYESNKVWFNTVEEAAASGRRGCSRCNPDSGNYVSKSGSASGSSTGDTALSYSEGYTAGYSAGLADGISDGYDAGMEDGYSDGYSDGEKAAREQAESEYAVKIEEAEKSASIRTAIGTVILCVPLAAFVIHVILNRELDRERESMAKRIAQEKELMQKEYNLSALRLLDPNAKEYVCPPPGVKLNITCVPVKGKPTKSRPFGDYTVYTTVSGKKYHCRCGCSGAEKPIHFFQIPADLEPCRNCVPPDMRDRELPSWYLDITGNKEL